ELRQVDGDLLGDGGGEDAIDAQTAPVDRYAEARVVPGCEGDAAAGTEPEVASLEGETDPLDHQWRELQDLAHLTPSGGQRPERGVETGEHTVDVIPGVVDQRGSFLGELGTAPQDAFELDGPSRQHRAELGEAGQGAVHIAAGGVERLGELSGIGQQGVDLSLSILDRLADHHAVAEDAAEVSLVIDDGGRAVDEVTE